MTLKSVSYWHDSVPKFKGGETSLVEGSYDVAIVGAGFTGLSAALALAKRGVSCVVLEARTVASGASGRNGGHVNNGLAHSFLSARKRFGHEQARALYWAFDAAVDTVERIALEEKIDCDFRRSGKIKLAAKASHFAQLRENYEAIVEDVDLDVTLIDRHNLSDEIISSRFYGGMLQKKSAMMHIGRFALGLAEAAVHNGAVIFENAAVINRHKNAEGNHVLNTGKGEVTAKEVFVATGAYTSGPFGWFKRRIVPVGSFIIATAPLNEEQVKATVPGLRTYVTSLNIGNYFRLTQDNRMIFGGRARFTGSTAETDPRSQKILANSLHEIFPQLKSIELQHCWGGMIDMTSDRFPRAGQTDDGMYYAMGYSGHGVQMSVHMGEIMAAVICGEHGGNPWGDDKWKALPGHFGSAWFLPLVGAYYKILDQIK